ncbi:MAG: cytochrome C biogenesis protein, partial [Cephaloticoccus sp.]
MKKLLPLIVLLLGAAWLASTLAARRGDSPFDLDGFGRLPVLANGRIKPLDTVARSALLQLQGRQRVKTAEGSITPMEWFATLAFESAKADALQTFEIVHPDVLALFQLAPEDGDKKKRFSFNQLQAQIPELMRQSQLAQQLEAPQRNPFQRAVIQLHANLNRYFELKHTLVMPDSEDFLGELLRFQGVLPEGVAAIRARQQGEPFSQEAFDTMIALGQRYDAMSSATSSSAIPPPGNIDHTGHDHAAEDDHAHWRTTG